MIGGLLTGIAGSAWARTALRYGVTALAILLFLLSLRCPGEQMELLAEQRKRCSAPTFLLNP